MCLAAGPVCADALGPFLCSTGCELSGPNPDGQTQTFIGEVANRYDDGMYELGDTVQVCNGSECATYSRAFMGFVLVGKETDTGGPYVNAEDSTGEGGTSGPEYPTRTPGGRRLSPIYMTAKSCVGDVCIVEWVIVGYQWV